MPPLIAALPAIAAAATIGAAGTTIGLDIANAGGGGTPSAAPATTTPAGPTPAQQLQQKEAVSQQLPTIEGLTSGFANPDYYAQQGGVAAGTAGQPGGNAAALRAVEQAFGLPPGSLSGLSAPGGTTGTPAKFTPSGSGATNQGAFPTGTSQLSEFVNTFFRG
jgi:hypothetical protein